MSKKNIFEIGLRLFGIYLLFQVPLALLGIGMAFAHDVSKFFTNIFLYRLVVILSPLFLLVMSWLLLFRAPSIASFFIKGDEPDKEQPAPSGSIYSLSFWIILIGLFYLVSSSSSFIGELVKFPITVPTWYSVSSILSHALALFFAVTFIFRSNKVVELIKKNSK